jgi:hypothetical protein
MLKRLPLWMGLGAAVWMMIAIRLVALRAIVAVDYIGFHTGITLPLVGREPSMLDVWILNTWLVLTCGVEFGLVGLLLRFAILRSSFCPSTPSPASKV